MALLRRRTNDFLISAWLVCAVMALAVGGLTLWDCPETRLPALFGWMVLGGLVHAAGGDRVSFGSLAFAAVFSLPIALTVLAAYEVHIRWGVSMSWALGVVLGVLTLHAALLIRALIASGSADYPYDD